MFAVWKWLPMAVKTVIRVPLDLASGAKLGARDEPHGAGPEIGGVVDRVINLDHLQRVDEGPGLGVVRVGAEAEAHAPARGREHGLVARGAAGEPVAGGVDGGPEGAVDDQVERGRRRRGRGAVEEGGAEDVAAVGVDGELVAVLGAGAARELAEGGEGRVEEALERERAGGAGGDVGRVGVPAEAAGVGGGGWGAAVEEVGEAAESLAGGEGEEEEEGGEETQHSGRC